MTKALVFGTGAVGSVYGWFLEKAGVTVTAVCRSNYNQVKQNGLLIRSKKWGRNISKPIAVPSVAAAKPYGPFDYILVCSKAFPDTHTLIKEAVTPGSAIVLAQNGIGIEEAYAKAYPQNSIISGVVYLPVVQVELGVVEHGTPLERFEVGTYPASASPPSKAQAEHFAELWEAGGATCHVYDDIQGQRWSKLALNATLNPICALTLCDDANFLRSSEDAFQMACDVMREVGRVAQAYGYNTITDESIKEHMKRHQERMDTGGKAPSMLQDVEHGRPIEVEAILGNAVRLAQGVKIDVPYLRLLYALAKGLNFSIIRDGAWRPIATVQ
ncbi:hypothetical protein H2198_001990 [Neophaeococcomyces mojaviensis]|uniref:Uncharacterized protein n=1 Tax=Neophaeococcomyces mojaviensis TaxID=3383035 RepID=A0ACC3AG05_9EURO|nr:hypothetical protein H2198_001990 [Knufia sp. JES_112]